MTKIDITRTGLLGLQAADGALAEFDRMRRMQALRHAAVALAFAFVAADVLLAIGSLARL